MHFQRVSTLYLWLFPFMMKGDIAVIFHQNRTFVSENHVVKLFILSEALLDKLQLFDSVRIPNQLSVFSAEKLHSERLIYLSTQVRRGHYIVSFHFSVDKVHWFDGDTFRWTFFWGHFQAIVSW